MRQRLTVILVLLSCFCQQALAQLHADFSIDHAGGCSPLVVHFTPLVTDGFGGAVGNSTYNWDLGNGNTAAIAAPEAVYASVGTYTITLTVSKDGATSTATHTVTVYPPPAVSFTAGPAVVCGAPVTFTGNTSGAAGAGGLGPGTIVSWLWDFGDGSTTTSYGPTITHQYASPGSTPLSVGATLTVTDNHGCTATLAQTGLAQVFPTLTAAFTPDKSILCTVSDPVAFTNSSAGPGTLSYVWNFGDGSSATTTNPNHVYPSAGNYSVQLTVTSSVGCTATYTQTTPMNVANYKTDFSFPTAGFCAGSTVSFTDNSSPVATNRMWSVDGLAVSPYDPFSYYFVSSGTHTVTLANIFGSCPQSVSKTVTINATPPVVPFSVTTQPSCGGYSVTVTDLSTTAYTRAWDPMYLVTASPSAFVPGSGASSTFGGYQYGELYGIGLLLTNSNGCSTLITEPVSLNKAYPSIYEPNPAPMGTCNTPITKTYAINYSGTLQSFSWDFGDGTSSTSPSPTHTWSQPGQYDIVLHYVDAEGCSGTTNALVTIIDKPISLNFTGSPTTVCSGSAVNFYSNLSTINTSSYSWDFGDNTGPSTTPFHIYYTPGVYTVTLTASTAGGCTATATQTAYITVIGPPGTYGGHTNSCANRNLVTFSYTSSNATSLAWDFGDGSTSTTAGSVGQVQHSYAQTGTYYLNLTATNGTCTAQYSDIVRVLTKQQPVLSAANAVCVNGSLNVQLAIARNPDAVYYGSYYDYTPQFYYADGTAFGGTVTFTNPYDPYTNGGFGWTLSGFAAGESGLYVVTNSFGFGCTDESNTIPLVVKGSATAALTVVSDGLCYQQPVVLKDASTVGPGNSITSGLWNFGDGQTQALVVGGQVSHLYTNPGAYTASLSINDAGGCLSSSGASVGTVSVDGPKASFAASATTMLFGSTLYLYNYTNAYGDGAVTYSWDFGDGSSSSFVSPSHVYAAPGTYTVTLTAAAGSSGAGSCSSVYTATIVVLPYNSHFQTTTGYVTSGACPPVLAQFQNTSYGYTSIAWNFGDGSTAGNVNSPSHVYASPGTYTVTLSLYGPGGGLDAQYTDVVNVRQPSASLATTTPAVCLGTPVQLQATAHGALSFLYDFGDGSVASGGADAVAHVYAAPGDYSVQLVVTDTVGCSVGALSPVAVSVAALPVVSVTPAAPVACLNGSVGLVASGAIFYSWSPPLGLDQIDVASPLASPLVTTLYTVTGIDNAGCSGVDTVTVRVIQPERLALSPDSTSLCAGDSLALHASGTDVYLWIGDTAGLASVSLPGPMAVPPASLRYTVVGSDAYGCFHDTLSVPVTVLPVPTVDAGPAVEVLDDMPVDLLATGSSDIVSWSWTPPVYLSCTDCAQPVCTPKKPEIYTVRVINGVGCSASDTVSVKLICEAARVRIPEAFTPNGDGHNDRFDILGIGQVDHLVIFDRWGQQVFERSDFYTADLSSQWDGTVHGQPAPVGTYVYFVEMTCPTGGAFARKGTVVLVR
jgi:gliding motility-associated-like protein